MSADIKALSIANLPQALLAANVELRQSLYQGAIFRIKATTASLSLVSSVVALLQEEFAGEIESDLSCSAPVQALRRLQFTVPAAALYERIGKMRQRLFGSPEVLESLYTLVEAHGFDRSQIAVDPARLRAVAHKGHENPLAAPAFTAHRDTWYANPQSQINWWLPLHDVSEGETFVFFADCFDKPVINDSAGFDYGRWIELVGWQNTSGVKAVYPSAGDFDRSRMLPFGCLAGEIILFSAAHLHQTSPNVSGAMRFSVDFRTVHLADQAQGKGAANVDNKSTGSAAVDYRQP